MMEKPKELLNRSVYVHYGQIYFLSGEEHPADDMEEAFSEQSNGLCGASFHGTLFLVTGTHTGRLNFEILLFEKEPALSDMWEEVVEVSINVQDDAQLTEWGESEGYKLDLKPGWYRARYCTIGMDAEHEWDDEMTAPSSEHYQLSFWPADQSPDTILRCTSKKAEYWHGALNVI